MGSLGRQRNRETAVAAVHKAHCRWKSVKATRGDQSRQRGWVETWWSALPGHRGAWRGQVGGSCSMLLPRGVTSQTSLKVLCSCRRGTRLSTSGGALPTAPGCAPHAEGKEVPEVHPVHLSPIGHQALGARGLGQTERSAPLVPRRDTVGSELCLRCSSAALGGSRELRSRAAAQGVWHWHHTAPECAAWE